MGTIVDTSKKLSNIMQYVTTLVKHRTMLQLCISANINSFPRFIHLAGTYYKSTKSHYEVLGVKEDADQKEIRAAYITLSKKVHPDVNPGAGASKQHHQEFISITESYKTLVDPIKRKQYDSQQKRVPVYPPSSPPGSPYNKNSYTHSSSYRSAYNFHEPFNHPQHFNDGFYDDSDKLENIGFNYKKHTTQIIFWMILIPWLWILYNKNVIKKRKSDNEEERHTLEEKYKQQALASKMALEKKRERQLEKQLEKHKIWLAKHRTHEALQMKYRHQEQLNKKTKHEKDPDDSKTCKP